MKNQKPKTKNQKPKTKNQKPKTKNQKPKTKNQKPKTKNQKRLNAKGFSLVSVMVATGLLGLLATGMMKMNELQMKNSKNAETKNEITALHSKLNQYLLDSKSCEQTFRAVDASLTGASLNLSSIKNNSGTDVYAINNTYGNNTVKITAMNLVPDGSTTLDIPTSGSKNFILYVKYKKNSKMTAQNTITKKINLVIQRDSSNVITCYSQLNNAVATAKSQICSDLGGTINTAGHCDITASATIKAMVQAEIAAAAAARAAAAKAAAAKAAAAKAAAAKAAAAKAAATGTIVTVAAGKACPAGSTVFSKLWTSGTKVNNAPSHSWSCTIPGGFSLSAPTQCSSLMIMSGSYNLKAVAPSVISISCMY